MFHNRDENLVALSNIRKSIAVRNEIYAFRSVSGEDYFFGMCRADKPLNRPPRILVILGRLHAEFIDSPKRIRVMPLVKPVHRVKHSLWSLCCCRVIYIHGRVLHKKRKIFFIILHRYSPPSFTFNSALSAPSAVFSKSSSAARRISLSIAARAIIFSASFLPIPRLSK